MEVFQRQFELFDKYDGHTYKVQRDIDISTTIETSEEVEAALKQFLNEYRDYIQGATIPKLEGTLIETEFRKRLHAVAGEVHVASRHAFEQLAGGWPHVHPDTFRALARASVEHQRKLAQAARANASDAQKAAARQASLQRLKRLRIVNTNAYDRLQYLTRSFSPAERERAYDFLPRITQDVLDAMMHPVVLEDYDTKTLAEAIDTADITLTPKSLTSSFTFQKDPKTESTSYFVVDMAIQRRVEPFTDAVHRIVMFVEPLNSEWVLTLDSSRTFFDHEVAAFLAFPNVFDKLQNLILNKKYMYMDATASKTDTDLKVNVDGDTFLVNVDKERKKRILRIVQLLQVKLSGASPSQIFKRAAEISEEKDPGLSASKPSGNWLENYIEEAVESNVEQTLDLISKHFLEIAAVLFQDQLKDPSTVSSACDKIVKKYEDLFEKEPRRGFMFERVQTGSVDMKNVMYSGADFDGSTSYLEFIQKERGAEKQNPQVLTISELEDIITKMDFKAIAWINAKNAYNIPSP